MADNRDAVFIQTTTKSTSLSPQNIFFRFPNSGIFIHDTSLAFLGQTSSCHYNKEHSSARFTEDSSY